MKNKTILFSLATIALASCQSKEFEVICEIPEGKNIEESATGYLCTYGKNNISLSYVDSAIVKNNRLVFKGEIEGSEVRCLAINGGQRTYKTAFILEPGVITIDLLNATARGTALNDLKEEYTAWSDSLENTIGDKYSKIVNDSTKSADEKQELENCLLQEYSQTVLDKAHGALENNKNNALGQYIFWQYIAYAEGMTPDKYKKELANAGEYIESFGPVKSITRRFEALEATQPGCDYVDFTIEHGNLDGTEAKLSDYVGNGKVILVDMWAHWCGPCRRAMPYIKEVYDKYHGEHFDVVSVAVWNRGENSREKNIEAIKELNMTWNQILDANSIPTDIYGVSGIPHLMLIGPDGKILARGLTPRVLDLWISSEIKKISEK